MLYTLFPQKQRLVFDTLFPQKKGNANPIRTRGSMFCYRDIIFMKHQWRGPILVTRENLGELLDRGMALGALGDGLLHWVYRGCIC